MQEWLDAGETDFGLPDLDPEEYMVGVLMDIGPIRSNGMAIGPTDWDIITPYAMSQGLDAEDTAILADMCKGYHAELQAGVNALCIAPVDRGKASR